MFLWVFFRFVESAEIFAETQNSFEEVTLKFIQLPEKDALKTFLLSKLASLKPQVCVGIYEPSYIEV